MVDLDAHVSAHAMADKSPIPANRLPGALKATCIQQIASLVVSSMLADFGETEGWVLCAILSFWPAVVWIAILRRERLSKTDRFYLTYGFPMIGLLLLGFGWRIHDFTWEVWQRY